MKKIYIANDYESNILGMVLSDSKEKAEIAFSARGIPSHHTEEIDPANNDIGIHGVCFILYAEIDNYTGKINKYIRGF